MGARRDELRFFVDASAMGLGKTLERARRDTVYPGHDLIKKDVPEHALDIQWIPYVAKREWVAIGRDRRIRTKPAELAQLKAAGLRYFWLGGKTDLATWHWLEWVVRHWDAMEEVIANEPAGPWFYVITKNGLRPMKV